jgi:mannose-6-phosphate isomerase-like protein (cupin superfamily)
MVAKLDGGCRVAGLKEGEPVRDGALAIWNHFRGDAVSLRVIELDGDASLRNDAAEEVLYVIDGSGTANGEAVETNTGIYLPPNTSLELSGSMTLLSTRCGGQAPSPVRTRGTGEGAGAPLRIVSLKDRPMQKTGDRWYRELITQQVTQFVGAIPPGRAPDHHHLYEEVICILDGEGTMWAGASSTPIASGSCIYLPRKQVHCVENRGTSELRLLGVFYPAGSPAARYT